LTEFLLSKHKKYGVGFQIQKIVTIMSLILGQASKCSEKWARRFLTGPHIHSTRGLFQVSSDQIPSLPHGGQIAVQTEHQLPARAQV